VNAVDWYWEVLSFLSSISKFSICHYLFNNLLLSKFRQPERFRYSRELRPKMLLGILTRFVQFFKFNLESLLKIPIDGSICTSFIHPSRFRNSRFGISKKFGVIIRFFEWERSIYVKLCGDCKQWKIETDTD
jgi:hypothetical protein